MLVKRLLEEEILAALFTLKRHFACKTNDDIERNIYDKRMTNGLENCLGLSLSSYRRLNGLNLIGRSPLGSVNHELSTCVKSFVFFEEVFGREVFLAVVTLEYFGATFRTLFSFSLFSVRRVLRRWDKVRCCCWRWHNSRGTGLIKVVRTVGLLKW